MRRAAKRDAIESDVCAALDDIRVAYERLNHPGLGDLLCWCPRLGYLMLECKSKAGTLTPAQVALHRKFPVCIVRSVPEALALFGVQG